MFSSIARSRTRSVRLLLSQTNSLLSDFGDLEARRSIMFIFEKNTQALVCVVASMWTDVTVFRWPVINYLEVFLIALCWFPTCERRNVLVSRVRSSGFILALLYRLLELNRFKYSS